MQIESPLLASLANNHMNQMSTWQEGACFIHIGMVIQTGLVVQEFCIEDQLQFRVHNPHQKGKAAAQLNNLYRSLVGPCSGRVPPTYLAQTTCHPLAVVPYQNDEGKQRCKLEQLGKLEYHWVTAVMMLPHQVDDELQCTFKLE